MAGVVNLTIKKGAKFQKSFIYKDSTKTPIPISSYKARMHIRKAVGSATFELELTDDNGRITLEAGGSIGQVDLYIGATDTDAFTISSGVYDLELYNPGDADDVIDLLEGKIIIKESVTR